MKSNNNAFWAAAFGAVVGGLTVYYLNTEEGKKMTKEAKRKIKRLEKDGRKALEKQSEILATKARKTFADAKERINDVSEKAKHKIADLTQKTGPEANNQQNDFNKGIKKANKELQAKLS